MNELTIFVLIWSFGGLLFFRYCAAICFHGAKLTLSGIFTSAACGPIALSFAIVLALMMILAGKYSRLRRKYGN